MKIYNVTVHQSAEVDIDGIADFLFANLSQESAYTYLRTIGDEIKSLSNNALSNAPFAAF